MANTFNKKGGSLSKNKLNYDFIIYGQKNQDKSSLIQINHTGKPWGYKELTPSCKKFDANPRYEAWAAGQRGHWFQKILHQSELWNEIPCTDRSSDSGKKIGFFYGNMESRKWDSKDIKINRNNLLNSEIQYALDLSRKADLKMATYNNILQEKRLIKNNIDYPQLIPEQFDFNIGELQKKLISKNPVFFKYALQPNAYNSRNGKYDDEVSIDNLIKDGKDTFQYILDIFTSFSRQIYEDLKDKPENTAWLIKNDGGSLGADIHRAYRGDNKQFTVDYIFELLVMTFFNEFSSDIQNYTLFDREKGVWDSSKNNKKTQKVFLKYFNIDTTVSIQETYDRLERLKNSILSKIVIDREKGNCDKSILSWLLKRCRVVRIFVEGEEVTKPWYFYSRFIDSIQIENAKDIDYTKYKYPNDYKIELNDGSIEEIGNFTPSPLNNFEITQRIEERRTKIRTYVIPVRNNKTGKVNCLLCKKLDVDVFTNKASKNAKLIANPTSFISNFGNTATTFELFNNYFLDFTEILLSQFTEEGKKYIWDQMKFIASLMGTAFNNYCSENTNSDVCFTILGLDLIIDDNGDVFFLEVNTYPVVQNYHPWAVFKGIYDSIFSEEARNSEYSSIESKYMVLGKFDMEHPKRPKTVKKSDTEPVVEPPVDEPPVVEPPKVKQPIIKPPVVEPSIVKPSIIKPAVVKPPIVKPTVKPAPVQIQSPLTKLNNIVFPTLIKKDNIFTLISPNKTSITYSNTVPVISTKKSSKTSKNAKILKAIAELLSRVGDDYILSLSDFESLLPYHGYKSMKNQTMFKSWRKRSRGSRHTPILNENQIKNMFKAHRFNKVGNVWVKNKF